MSILTDKLFRAQAAATAAILLSLVLLGQLLALQAAADFKTAMLDHDARLAGYLVRSGLEDSVVSAAFTADKTDTDAKQGEELLLSAGYGVGTRRSLLPDAERFYRGNASGMLLLTAAISALLLAAFCIFARLRDKRIDRAAAALRRYMDGDTGVRLNDSGEGSLSRLFTEINGLATSLTSHIHNEKQSREFLKETISDISHQLKTPLAALRMYNDIIKEEKADGDTVDSFLSKSERELTRMETLIQNLLKLARLDAGTIGIEKSEHDLTDFLEDCAGGFLTRAELEGKRLSLRHGDTVISRFDWMWLKEAVCNIIKNALDHTENGDSVEISCAKNTVYTEITIIDTGSGIHKEDIHHIFKRFYRSRFSKDRQGIGIGLALSKAIVEKHGGTITVESEPEKGAAFHIILPNLSNL